MSPDERVQVKRFIGDEAMCRAIHKTLKRIFNKPPKNKDVQSLAAAWMSKESFDDAWRELQQISKSEAREPKVEGNIGV